MDCPKRNIFTLMKALGACACIDLLGSRVLMRVLNVWETVREKNITFVCDEKIINKENILFQDE